MSRQRPLTLAEIRAAAQVRYGLLPDTPDGPPQRKPVRPAKARPKPEPKPKRAKPNRGTRVPVLELHDGEPVASYGTHPRWRPLSEHATCRCVTCGQVKPANKFMPYPDGPRVTGERYAECRTCKTKRWSKRPVPQPVVPAHLGLRPKPTAGRAA